MIDTRDPGFDPQLAPGPTPVAPRPVAPASRLSWPVKIFGGLFLAANLLIAGIVAKDHFGPTPVTPPPSPDTQTTALGAAMKAHYAAGPAGVVAISARVRSGELATASDVQKAFAADAKPIVEQLLATVKTHCDVESGKITDPPGLAEDLKRAGEFAGAK